MGLFAYCTCMIIWYWQHITKRYESSSCSVGFVSQHISHDRWSRWMVLIWPMKRLFSSNCRFFSQWQCMNWWFTIHAKSKNRCTFTFQPSHVLCYYDLSWTFTLAEMITLFSSHMKPATNDGTQQLVLSVCRRCNWFQVMTHALDVLSPW